MASETDSDTGSTFVGYGVLALLGAAFLNGWFGKLGFIGGLYLSSPAVQWFMKLLYVGGAGFLIYGAYLWRTGAGKEKGCPFCTETIPKAATRCPHCAADLSASMSAPTSATTPPATTTGSVTDRLKQLQTLKDQGLVSEADYDAKKADLLKEL